MIGKLSLKERYVLFALDDEFGYIITNNTAYWVGLAGTVLYEMIQEGLLSMEKDSLLAHDHDSEVACYKKVLSVIEKSKNPPKVETVLLDLWNYNQEIQQEIIEMLILKGVLKEVKKTRFWFIKFKRYPTINHIPEKGLRKYLLLLIKKNRILSNENYLLLRMVDQCDLIIEVFGKENESTILQYIKNIQQTIEPSGELFETIKILETAMLSAIDNKNLQLILEDG